MKTFAITISVHVDVEDEKEAEALADSIQRGIRDERVDQIFLDGISEID